VCRSLDLALAVSVFWLCLREDDVAGVPGVVSRCPQMMHRTAFTSAQRVQTSPPPPSPLVNHNYWPGAGGGGRLPSNTLPAHYSAATTTATTTYRPVTSFKAPVPADCDSGNDVCTAPGNRCLNRLAEVGAERPLAATMPRHHVAVRLLERTNNATGDPVRRWRELNFHTNIGAESAMGTIGMCVRPPCPWSNVPFHRRLITENILQP